VEVALLACILRRRRSGQLRSVKIYFSICKRGRRNVPVIFVVVALSTVREAVSNNDKSYIFLRDVDFQRADEIPMEHALDRWVCEVRC
jgi:hypothetical protein